MAVSRRNLSVFFHVVQGVVAQITPPPLKPQLVSAQLTWKNLHWRPVVASDWLGEGLGPRGRFSPMETRLRDSEGEVTYFTSLLLFLLPQPPTAITLSFFFFKWFSWISSLFEAVSETWAATHCYQPAETILDYSWHLKIVFCFLSFSLLYDRFFLYHGYSPENQVPLKVSDKLLFHTFHQDLKRIT